MNKGSNLWAIAGLICAFLFAPAGLVLSIVGMNKAKQDNGNGAGMAKAGMIISIVLLVIEVIVLIVSLSIAGRAADQAFDMMNQIPTP